MNAEQRQFKLRHTISHDLTESQIIRNNGGSAFPLQVKKSENETCCTKPHEEKMIIDKEEFAEFTKSYARQRIETEEQLEQLQKQVQERDTTILKLQQQIEELKKQEEYLLRAIQELRDKVPKSTMIDSKTKIIKMKEIDIQHLTKQNLKLKQWLKEEKEESLKCLECVKMKDIVISGLEQELQNLKLESKPKRKRVNTDELSQKEFMSLKAISNNSKSQKQINTKKEMSLQQQCLAKQKEKSVQLQAQIYELSEYIQKLKKNAHATFVERNPEIKTNHYPELESPILKLLERSSKKISEKGAKQQEKNNRFVDKEREELLLKKCAYLESQLQMFINRSLPRKPGPEQVLKQPIFEF